MKHAKVVVPKLKIRNKLVMPAKFKSGAGPHLNKSQRRVQQKLLKQIREEISEN
jgi:hypothetical protein